MRVNARKRTDAYVTVDGIASDIFISGMAPRNRAFDGDIVVRDPMPVPFFHTIADCKIA